MPDQKQFHEAVRRGGNAWYGACLRITRDAALAQDAVQDALLSAWRKRRQFKGHARLDTWIHRIAVNAAISAVKRQQRYKLERVEEPVDTESGAADQNLINGELSRDLHAALEELTEMERMCFVLKHLEEWRLAEIARELQISTGSVKQALFRGVKKLRVRMDELREAK